MAAENAKIKVEATLQDNVSAGMKTMAGNVSGSANQVNTSMGGMASAAMTAAKAFVGLVVVQKITGYLSECAKEGQEAAMVFARLAAINKVTGNAVGLTTDELSNMAAEYQKVSIFGDEAVMSAQAQILTFSKIGKEIFPEVMKASVDMGSAMGDVGAAANAIGRAMESPIEGTRALRQAGIYLTDQTEAQIKKFMDAGDILSAQKIILSEVTTRYDGMTEAMRNTPIGELQAAKERLGDIKEVIGGNGLINLTTIWYDGLTNILEVITEIFNISPKAAKGLTTEDDLNQIKIWKDELTSVSESIKSLEAGLLKLKSYGGTVLTDVLEGKIANQKMRLEILTNDIAKGEAVVNKRTSGRSIITTPTATTGAKKTSDIDFDEGYIYANLADDMAASAAEHKKMLDDKIAAETAANNYINDLQMQAIAQRGDARATELAELDIWYSEQTILAQKYGEGMSIVEELNNAKKADINKKYDDIIAQNKKNVNSQIAISAANLADVMEEIALESIKGNRERAIVEKSIAIGKSVISTGIAIAKANEAGYPQNIPLMILAGATGTAQTILIAAQKFSHGGIVSGSRTRQDSVPAMLTGGEGVFTERQQAQLFKLANGGNGSGVQADFSIIINGNADDSTIDKIAMTREKQLSDFRMMYNELVYKRQI
jgi:hypothetical protein